MFKEGLKILFGRRSLEDMLGRNLKFRLSGITFEIKKIDPINYLDGSQSMIKIYDTYSRGESNRPLDESDMKKIRAHFKDVFLASVVSPKLARKEDQEGFFVDKLFVDWDLCNRLYEQIIEFTYGKKKRR